MFTLGVEEEYHLVDGQTLELRAHPGVLTTAKSRLGDNAAAEISTSQLEVATPVCATLGEVREALTRLRTEAGAAAAANGCRILAMGSHPFADWREQRLTTNPRYVALFERWGILALQQLITGCHVHVGVEDAELNIAILDRVTPWLPALLALSASSPFWEGSDTGYASYRTVWFDRWPVSGPPERLGSRAAYDQLIAAMTSCGAIDDASHVYWEVRPSARYPTLEFRVADACPSLDDAVLQAALARSLTRTLAMEVKSGGPAPVVRRQLIRLARWRAARHGLSGTLVHPLDWHLQPAAEVVGTLLEFLRADLVAHNEWEEVEALAAQALGRGTAAARYRQLMNRTGNLREVTAAAVAETAGVR